MIKRNIHVESNTTVFIFFSSVDFCQHTLGFERDLEEECVSMFVCLLHTHGTRTAYSLEMHECALNLLQTASVGFWESSI